MSTSCWRRMAVVAVLGVLAFGAADSWCWGAVVVDSAYYTGSRDTGTGGGLVASTGNTKWSGGAFEISWVIIQNGASFDYEYTITTPDNALLSHWILELSKFSADDILLTDSWNDTFEAGDLPADSFYEVKDYDTGLPSNPGQPYPVYGVKFEFDKDVSVPMSTTYAFTSSQVPVWGDFYAIDGRQHNEPAWAYNAGFGLEPSPGSDPDEPYLDWIPRPDGVTGQIPEPMSLIVWLLLFAPIGVFRLRRHRML